MTALLGLDARLRLARLYLCTDAREREGDLADFLAAALAGGVDIVQIREPGLSPKAALAALEVASEVAAPHQAIVCVSDSATWAEHHQADMLHLGQSGDGSAAARRHLQPWALLGRSTHDSRQVVAAVADADLDYFTAGPIRPSRTSPDASPVGLELIRYAAEAAPVYAMASKPWFAVGGITAANLDEVLEAGARRICVGGAITRAGDPEQAAAELSGRLRAAWRDDPGAERYTFAAAASTGRTA